MYEGFLDSQRKALAKPARRYRNSPPASWKSTKRCFWNQLYYATVQYTLYVGTVTVGGT